MLEFKAGRQVCVVHFGSFRLLEEESEQKRALDHGGFSRSGELFGCDLMDSREFNEGTNGLGASRCGSSSFSGTPSTGSKRQSVLTPRFPGCVQSTLAASHIFPPCCSHLFLLLQCSFCLHCRHCTIRRMHIKLDTSL